MIAARACAALASVALAGGCVIPVAPEFEDEENHPPYVLTSVPGVGGVVTTTLPIKVTVADPNVNDYLYVHWLIDYPGVSPNSRVPERYILEPTGRLDRTLRDFQPSCTFHSIAPGFVQHRLLLSVGDRPFSNPESESVPSESQLDSVKGGHRVRAVWLLTADCP